MMKKKLSNNKVTNNVKEVNAAKSRLHYKKKQT